MVPPRATGRRRGRGVGGRRRAARAAAPPPLPSSLRSPAASSTGRRSWPARAPGPRRPPRPATSRITPRTAPPCCGPHYVTGNDDRGLPVFTSAVLVGTNVLGAGSDLLSATPLADQPADGSGWSDLGQPGGQRRRRGRGLRRRPRRRFRSRASSCPLAREPGWMACHPRWSCPRGSQMSALDTGARLDLVHRAVGAVGSRRRHRHGRVPRAPSGASATGSATDPGLFTEAGHVPRPRRERRGRRSRRPGPRWSSSATTCSAATPSTPLLDPRPGGRRRGAARPTTSSPGGSAGGARAGHAGHLGGRRQLGGQRGGARHAGRPPRSADRRRTAAGEPPAERRDRGRVERVPTTRHDPGPGDAGLPGRGGRRSSTATPTPR